MSSDDEKMTLVELHGISPEDVGDDDHPDLADDIDRLIRSEYPHLDVTGVATVVNPEIHAEYLSEPADDGDGSRVTLWSRDGLRHYEGVEAVTTEFGDENTVHLVFEDGSETTITDTGLTVKDVHSDE